jgi:hypothetical protein
VDREGGKEGEKGRDRWLLNGWRERGREGGKKRGGWREGRRGER